MEEELLPLNIDVINFDNIDNDNEEENIFITNCNSKISINVSMQDVFSYCDWHADVIQRAKEWINSTDFSLINSISIINKTNEELNGLSVKFSFSEEYFAIDDISLPSFISGDVRIPFLKVDKLKLDKLVSKTSCEIKISLINTESGIEVCEPFIKVFIVLPISEPSDLINEERRLLAKFVIPLTPEIKQLTIDAVANNDGRPFIAYQNKDNYNAIIKELNAIYITLHEANIIYQNPPAGDSCSQRIRLPEEVLKDKKGTCLDTSILVCSVLEEIGYHPLLIEIDHHAFVAVFLDEDLSLPSGITDKISDITSFSSDQNSKIVFFETTRICSLLTDSFQDCMDKGKAKLTLYTGDYFSAIDIHVCHKNNYFSPIPAKNDDYEIVNHLVPKDIENRELNPIINGEYEDVQVKFENDRFKSWEKKLLDLTEANRLVKFKIRHNNCVRLKGTNFIKKISENETIRLLMVDLTEDETDAALKEPINSLSESILEQNLYVLGIEKVFKSIIKKAKDVLEETGASPLYLSLGMFSYQSPKTKNRIQAPFLLLPITIKRESGGNYLMSYDLNDLRINETFFEYFKLNDKSVNFKTFYDFNNIDQYYDAVDTFKKTCKVDISIDENFFFISNLSFAHQVMWLDMIKRRDELEKNTIVKSIIDNQSHIENNVTSENESIDKFEKYTDFVAPLPYDSSQLKAILDCGAGKSFILDGPPGTGKSQTIVNMICNAIYKGKKVLFVAEKKAALEVVFDRLTQIELGNYCLELHSNKATKTDFFGKLEKVMDFNKVEFPIDYEEKCLKLTNEKNALLKTINDMHSGDNLFFSLYDCIVDEKKYEKIANKVSFDIDFVKSMDKEKYEQISSLITSYFSKAKAVPNFDNSILKVFEIENINFYGRDDLVKDLLDCERSIQKYMKSIEKFKNNLSFEVNNFNDYADVFELLKLAYENDYYLSNPKIILENSSSIENSFKSMEMFKIFKNQTNKTIDIDNCIHYLNIKDLHKMLILATSKFSKMIKTRRVKKALKPFVKYKINNKKVPMLVLQIEEYCEAVDKMNNLGKPFTELIGNNPFVELDNLESIKYKFEKTKEFFNAISMFSKGKDSSSILSFFVEKAKNKEVEFRLAFDSCFNDYKEYCLADNMISNKYKLNKSAINSDNYPMEVINLIDYAIKDERTFEEFYKLSIVNIHNKSFSTYGVRAIIDEIQRNRCPVSKMQDLFDGSFAHSSLVQYFKNDGVNSFLAKEYEDKVSMFLDAIAEFKRKSIECIAAKISSSSSNNMLHNLPTSEIGRLRKSITNRGRGSSIRKTLSDFGTKILEYFPCFLMSPLSAAQYLSVDSESGKAFSKFDVVIFDEASQIPTHEAIGPIARGNSLIVSGDPKQMPPTKYFVGDVLDYEDDELTAQYTDSPSLLDECLSIELPRHRLSYHYRSKHESLIQFSNENFYGNGLFTFPSSSTATSFISYEFVKTSTPKIDSKLSIEEKNEIISKFKDIYTDPATSKKSVGIIVFNVRQRDEVYEAITDLLEENDNLRLTVENAGEITKEPFFVKSIENVQGDERDIIIISVGFALAKTGVPKLGGPLIQNNGERRLNVVASRSKEKMIVLSTIKSIQFQDDNKISNKGALCLKRFLHYAEESSFSNCIASSATENDLIYYIKKDLENEGYDVITNVGRGEFKVDLAIKNKESDMYELGVLLDTKTIDKNISFGDKYIVQVGVLNSMKWKVVRVYSLEYHKNPKETIEKIMNAMKQTYHEEQQITKPVISESNYFPKQSTYEIVEYEIPQFINIPYSNDIGYDLDQLDKAINIFINATSPASYGEIKKYVEKCTHFQKITDFEETELLARLTLKFANNRTEDQIKNNYVYWANESREMNAFRKASGRDIYDIPIDELLCVFKQIIGMHGSALSAEDLFRFTLEVLEYQTMALTERILNRLRYVYNIAKENGIIR